MDIKSTYEESLALSYIALRKFIGFVGLVFPFILAIGALIIFQTSIQSSISAYYHTGMRDVFVGILCVIGLFLLVYKGYEKCDDIAGDLGCLFALGVALFPVTPDDAPENASHIIGNIHTTFAALFFFTLIYFSLVLFTKTDPKKKPTKTKQQRNIVYKICGWTMVICILLIAIYSNLPDSMAEQLKVFNPKYWLETVAIVAFAYSWITKWRGNIAGIKDSLEG